MATGAKSASLNGGNSSWTSWSWSSSSSLTKDPAEPIWKKQNIKSGQRVKFKKIILLFFYVRFPTDVTMQNCILGIKKISIRVKKVILHS